MQDSRTWDTVRRIMPPEGVHAPDYVRNATGYSFDALAEAIHRSVGSALAESKEERVLLVGYSMGGRVAIEYALRFPETLGGLVLESAGLGCFDEEERERFAARNEQWAQRMESAASIDEIVEWWEQLPLFASQKEQPEEAQRAQRAMRLAQEPAALAAQLRESGVQNMPIQPDTLDMMVSLDLPILYVAGKRDGRYSRMARACEAAGITVSLLDCGHNVHMERPSEFAQVLNRARGME